MTSEHLLATSHQVPVTLHNLLEPVASLELYPSNPRRGDLALITESLERNGQYRPVVVNRPTRQVLAGNHTVSAARLLGWTHVAVTWVDVDDEAAARIVLVDNRASDLAGYDDRELAEVLSSLPDLEGTGYVDADLAALLAGDEPVALTDPDDAPAKPAKPRSKLGDVWVLGQHRLLCGDATDQAAVTAMLDGWVPDCVWTDPPYGVSYVGGTKEALSILNDGKADLPRLLPAAFRTVVAVARPGAPVYVAHADTERITFECSMVEAGLLVRQNLIWVKSSLVMGRADYHYRHEPILEASTPEEHEPVLYGFVPGEGRLGRGGKRWYGDNKQSTVFEVAKPARNGEHPTMKPIELIQRMLSNSCPPGGVVLDLFGGSGSTLIAAHHHRARAALVELDPIYVDVICRRFQEHTGVVPVLASSGAAVDFTEGS